MTQAQNLNLTIRDDEPPAEYSGSKVLARIAAVVTLARALKPGQWFEWVKPPANWKKRKDELLKGIPVVCYRTSDKRVVVRHKEAGRAAETPRTTKPEPTPTPTANHVGLGLSTFDSSVPHAPKPRAILAAMARVGTALNMGELAAKVGAGGLADAVEQLRAAKYLSTDVVKGKQLHTLTPKGFEAGQAINAGGGV